MPLIYDDPTHSYAWRGRGKSLRLIPSVTTILKDAGVSDMSFVTPEGLERGTRVHATIAYKIYKKQKAGHDGWVAGTHQPFANSALKFLADVNAKVEAVESMIFNRELWYAGRVDLVCEFNGRRWLIDWKLNEGWRSPHVGPQLAAYKHAWNAAHKPSRHIDRVACVQLTETNYTFRAVDPSDEIANWHTFLRAREKVRNERDS